MRAACLAAGVVLALMAGVLRSWATLVGLLLVAGLVSATLQPAANLFLARRARPEHQGVSFGIK